MQSDQYNNSLKKLQRKLAALEQIERGPHSGGLLDGKRIGLEKEGLRVNANGALVLSDHPKALGSALCNSSITTDFSEALLELVTPALLSASDAYDFLGQAHKFVYHNLPEEESIWNTSMPCVLEQGHNIRVADYGSSNIGTMKKVYRHGLGLRYGKVMQAIAGVHYNFSWPAQLWHSLATLEAAATDSLDQETTVLAGAYLQASQESTQDRAAKGASSHAYVSQRYMATTRNLLRHGWLIPLLFGVSPAVCRSFLQGGELLAGMKLHKEETCYEPFATSLRMGDIGYNYKRDAAASVSVDYSSVESYTGDLQRLVTTPHTAYREAGVRNADGEYQQLNHNILQIENEYYSSVRPKQLTLEREPPVHAMRKRGIMYLELRSLDVSVFEPLGVSLEQLHFLEVFMLYSLLMDSPAIDDAEMRMLADNRKNVAHQGRDPALQLLTQEGARPLRDCAHELLDGLDRVAEFLDADAVDDGKYQRAVQSQREKINDYSKTPSACLLENLLENNLSFVEFASAQSLKAAEHCRALEKNPAIWSGLEKAVTQSLQKQQELEAADVMSFDDYLQEYLKQLESGDELA